MAGAPDVPVAPVGPVRVTLVWDREPPGRAVLAALSERAIDVEVCSAGVFDAPPDGAEILASDRPLALLWLSGPLEQGAEELLACAVAWRDRSGPALLLMGCAPDGTPDDAERAMAAGFDDFVAGRSSPRELAARLWGLARRLGVSAPSAVPPAPLTHGRLVLDAPRQELWVAERRVRLTRLEVSLVAALMEAHGSTLTRAELVDRVWGGPPGHPARSGVGSARGPSGRGEDNLDVGARAVDNLILRLRRKSRTPGLIATVRGVGFRLTL